MPKILITGNGFDLNFGLPTSYMDFIKIMNFVVENESADFESIYSNSQTYSRIIENFNTFEINEESLIKVKIETHNSLWFQFFKDEYEIETWIDFENKIEYVLKNLFLSVNYLKKTFFATGILVDQLPTYTLNSFGHQIVLVEVLNRFKIVNFDGYYITIDPKFLVSKYNHYIDVDLDKISKFLNQQLLEFKLVFNYYFEIFVYPFYDNLKQKFKTDIFSTINRHYTFNYTPTFDKFYQKKTITSYLHGKINSKENQIVLGISETPNNDLIDTKYFIPFTKYFQKLNNNTDYIFIKEYEKHHHENFLFFFWGHSLDISDEDYINEVFDLVNKLKSIIKKIVVIYHNETSKSKLLANLLYIRGKKDIDELMRGGNLVFLDIDSKELKQELDRDIARRSISAIM